MRAQARQHRARLIDAADRIAVVASAACLLHCLALPILFAALPALAKVFHLPESFHLWMVAVAVPTSGYALLKGRGGDSGTRPLLTGVVGLGLLLIGALVAQQTTWEVPTTVAGGLTLAMAHVFNWRCRHTHSGELPTHQNEQARGGQL